MSRTAATSENAAARIRAALQLLREHRDGIGNVDGRSGIFARVRELVPFNDHESVVLAGNTPRGDKNFSFDSSGLVTAGWITKNNGTWRITDAGVAALEEFSDPGELRRALRRVLDAERRNRKANRAEALRSTLVSRSPDEDLIREAAQLFTERGLRDGESVFSPGRTVWTRECFEELKTAFIDAPDESDRQFRDKLPVQMQQVSDDARLLMAEMIAWQFLPIHKTSIGKRAKEARVEIALNAMDHPVQVPEPIAQAFATGVAKPGRTMVNDQYWAVVFLLNLLGSWLERTPEDQEELLDDPWAWKEFVLSVPGNSIPTQRNAAMYLVHPDSFINFFSVQKKQQIRDAFIGEIPQSHGDVDRDLFDISLALQQKAGTHVDFYEDPYKSQWDISGGPLAATSPGPVPGPEEDEEPADPQRVRAPFPGVSHSLAQKVFMDTVWLQKQLDLLERRRQVIFYGPPGTGKTFLAMAMADHVTGGEKYTQLVQFHPSYSYEDFFEGYRPITDQNGHLSYHLKDGPLRRMVNEALANPEYNYVLVIDEINRGNLAKIFGELYFLLEYRHRKISLQYSEEPFELPENLFIIGTMNTSDRSIALMDAAMRRRFAFVELHPDSEPVSRVLPGWLAANDSGPEPAALLQQLNKLIDDPDFRIGPSYLMPKDGRLDEQTLQQVWEHEILPLLEEHHYGQGVQVATRYGLPALRSVLARQAIPDLPRRETGEPDLQNA
ncbi:AAA family ATPase [Arthrobacter sp. GCM10027362]|uniref:AAA family ATPase n=1 Tax=Arthrobacter sp. GCM10027362 TaxID=3273379 RepID=UPI00363A0960